MTPVVGITCSTLLFPDLPSALRCVLPEDYVTAVVRAGGLPLVLPSLEEGSAEAVLAQVDGVLLSGGVDVDPSFFGEDPRLDLGQVDQVRDRFEIALARAAHRAGVPVLAICRGPQVLNVARGGTLVQHIPAQVEGAIRHDQKEVRTDAASHSVAVVPGTRLHALLCTTALRVNSFHHQSVDRLAPGFVVSARAPDGVVEAIEDPTHPWCLGVQWHPERMRGDRFAAALFAGFVEAVRARKGPATGARPPRG